MALFVPLIAGAPAGPIPTMPTRLKPITLAATTFEPTTAATMKSEVAAVTTPAVHVQHGPPKVTFERHGETITHIRVECGCGQVTELKCEY